LEFSCIQTANHGILVHLNTMKELNLKNEFYTGASGRKSLVDLTIPSIYSGKLILFIHGYMGFKDWGAWNLVEDYFLDLGFGFCTFNISHNGCSPDHPKEFVDLDAFGKNSYPKELEDVKQVLDWMENKLTPLPEIYVIGHSRGGGIALLAAQDSRIKKAVSWAGISNIEKRFPTGKLLAEWESTGKREVLNGRTGQKMPLYYSQYTDFLAQKNKLNIETACTEMAIPCMVIHGSKDVSVDISEGEELASWLKIDLQIIPDANHTFGSSEPWTKNTLPTELKMVCDITSEFLLKNQKKA
jgi:pimeloyl-ACP methyl ester carboxylesterase